jgi:hypothetical protein
MPEHDCSEGREYPSKPKKNIVRTPRRSVPVVFSRRGTDQTKGHLKSEVRRQPRPLSPEKTELKEAPDLLDTAPTMCEDKKISMKPLHRFAKDKLPRESLLREILLMEKQELSPEQFVDRMQIWLRLMEREN